MAEVHWLSVAPHRLDQVEKKLIEMMSMEKVVAWGECGLDYFDKKTRGQVSWLHQFCK